jgi:hypothetical protein
MSERIVPAKNGSFTLYNDETALHSLYDPGLEAEKFIASLSLEGRNYRYFILMEPGLGYMVPALREKFPSAAIISLHCSAFFSSPECAAHCRQNGASVSWSPGSDSSLEDFLESALSDASPDSIRLIEWRPAAAAYGREFVDMLYRTVEVIRRAAANKTTVRGFGRRWLRNSLRNLGLLRRLAAPRQVTRPFLLSASGPSLEAELPALAALASSRHPPFFMAVSSSVPCLVSAGIMPDLVIAADGGSWALLHLYESVRLSGGFPGAGGPRFAAALSAALPSQAGDYPALVLADGSVWQRYLLSSLGLPFAAFPQRGTVSASALDLAFFLTSGPVYISGLDFGHADLVTHCRPYAFDRLRDERADRLKPAYSGAFEREAMIRRSQALSVYEAWFKKERANYPRRLYTVSEGNRLGIPRGSIGNENHVFSDSDGSLSGGSIFDGSDSDSSDSDSSGGKDPSGRGGTERGGNMDCFGEQIVNVPENGKNAAAVLLRGLEDPFMGKQIGAELGELLFPDEKDIRKADIEDELKKRIF